MAKSITDQIARRQDAKQIDSDFLGMFGLNQGKSGVTKLAMDALHDFEGDPFKDRSGQEMAELMESMNDIGLIQPIVVRAMPTTGQYQILAGRRRKNAALALGWTEIDAIIMEADDRQALEAVIDTNLRSRSRLFPSKKAFAYKMQLEVLKHQGQRNYFSPATCEQIAHKTKSRDIVAAQYNTSKDDIQRHIRLTHLIEPLLERVDADEIPFTAGVELSYLSADDQRGIQAFLSARPEYRLSLSGAKALRRGMDNGNELDCIEAFEEILGLSQSHKEIPTPRITISRKRLAPYIEHIPKDINLEDLFIEFLKEKFGK